MSEAIPILSDPTYQIESEIGSGGGGIVYKAWHKRLQMHVVIKELKCGSQNDIETQRNEVEALKNVKSEFLPQVFDFITEGDRIYTVMEFIEGESLDKLLDRGQKFSQTQVVKWYRQLVSALEVIHKKNVCHRDIKPANTMLMPNGNVCLIDFNAALVSGNDVTLISRSLGYASPEQYEIYEHYKNKRASSPINLGVSGIRRKPAYGTETELVDDDKTELINDSELTEFWTERNFADKTELVSSKETFNIDWQRSDVYSLGATMYHLISGSQPSERAVKVVSISKLGRFSEGIIYVIEQSMRLNPAERFASATVLAGAVQNIHKHDARWRIAQSKKIAAAIILPLVFALFAATTLVGQGVMAQEREGRFYTAVFNIQNSDTPQQEFDDALEIFWDRIDPYLAMAMRLWNEGDVIATRTFIEANLGNIAKFQSVPEAARSFGDIYFILGNTYYFQPGEPDYRMARENFHIALQFVTDNPILYRDYAISLARTGEIVEAERILEITRSLDLESDSLNLLAGEISFARHEFDNALAHFSQVIAITNDDYLRYRAFHTSDDIFRLLGQPERSVELLSGALNRIPLNRLPEMTERLADAYVRTGDYSNAIRLFEQLVESGAPQFHIFHGLAILLQNYGELGRAALVLDQMADFFPNDYRVPMRRAFLEADRQSRIANEYRDYELTSQYYESAVMLYAANVRPGVSDPEMQQLRSLIEQLRANNWID